MVLEHSEKKDITLQESRFAIIPTAAQFTITEVRKSFHTWSASYPSLNIYKNKMYIHYKTRIGIRFSRFFGSSYDGTNWTTKKNPGGMAYITPIRVFDDKLFAYNHTEYSNYDADKDTWSTTAKLLDKDGNELFTSNNPSFEKSRYVVFKNKLYVIFGVKNKGIYSSANDVNFTNENITYPYDNDNTKFVVNGGLVVHNGKIWIVGGEYYTGSTSTSTYLNKVYSYDGTTLKQETDFPVAVTLNILHSFKGGLISVGVYNSGGYYNKLYYSPYGTQWYYILSDNKLKHFDHLSTVIWQDKIWFVVNYSGEGVFSGKLTTLSFTP